MLLLLNCRLAAYTVTVRCTMSAHSTLAQHRLTVHWKVFRLAKRCGALYNRKRAIIRLHRLRSIRLAIYRGVEWLASAVKREPNREPNRRRLYRALVKRGDWPDKYCLGWFDGSTSQNDERCFISCTITKFGLKPYSEDESIAAVESCSLFKNSPQPEADSANLVQAKSS